ncbi:MAG: protein O-mannosyl-transferase family, partial [Bacteroidota bacterium]
MQTTLLRNLIRLFIFGIVLTIPLLNAPTGSLGFADASEFALCVELGSIAHPPGFPAYILLAHGFMAAVSQLMGTIDALMLFSALCMALASLLLFRVSEVICAAVFPGESPLYRLLAATVSALAPITGATIWHWSHAVEVYTLQVLFSCMLLNGIILRQEGKVRAGSLWAGLAIGLGLANHHLSMVFLLPVALVLWPLGWLRTPFTAPKGNSKQPAQGLLTSLREPDTAFGAALALAVLIVCYGWMMISSAADHAFAFGSADTFSRLMYHLSGGAWIKNTQSVVKGIVGMRLPYFMNLVAYQFLAMGAFIIAGFIVLTRSSAKRLAWVLCGFFVVLLLYQLRIDQTADTDAYLCVPFVLLSVLIGPGILQLSRLRPWMPATALVLIPFQLMLNFPRTDLRDFDLGPALMNDLSDAAPKGSVVLIADWTTSIMAQQARISRDYRTDLCVLNYDIKFTHRDLLQRNHPEVYAAIAPEYERLMGLFEQFHPEELYNTGCTLDQPALLAAYKATIDALQRYCRNKGVEFLADPKAYVFLSQQGLFPTAQMSGSMISNTAGNDQGNDAFLNKKHAWIDNSCVLH